jgi:hypothetical protein
VTVARAQVAGSRRTENYATPIGVATDDPPAPRPDDESAPVKKTATKQLVIATDGPERPVLTVLSRAPAPLIAVLATASLPQSKRSQRPWRPGAALTRAVAS